MNSRSSARNATIRNDWFQGTADVTQRRARRAEISEADVRASAMPADAKKLPTGRCSKD
jgi:hypothetical protein